MNSYLFFSRFYFRLRLLSSQLPGICDAPSKRSKVSRRDIKIEWAKRNIIRCCVHCYWSAQQYTGWWTARVHAPYARHPERARSTNTRARVRTPTTRTMTSIYWLYVVGLFASTCRHRRRAALNGVCVLNFLSMLSVCARVCNDRVNAWPEPSSPIDNSAHFVQHRIWCQTFHIFLGAFQKIYIKIVQPSTPKSAPIFTLFLYTRVVSFFCLCIGRPLHSVDTLFIFGTFDLYTDTHAQARIIMIILHMRHSLPCGTRQAHSQTEPSGHWRDACASPSYLGETQRYVL